MVLSLLLVQPGLLCLTLALDRVWDGSIILLVSQTLLVDLCSSQIGLQKAMKSSKS